MSGPDDSQLLPFLHRIQKRDGSIPHFEVVLGANNMSGSAGRNAILASRVLQQLVPQTPGPPDVCRASQNAKGTPTHTVKLYRGRMQWKPKLTTKLYPR
jgi:hypothetical protein